MNARIVWRSWLVLLVLTLLLPPSVRAQVGDVRLGDLETRFQGGVVLPASDYGDYFTFGPTFGLDVGLPLHDRLDLILDLDVDLLNNGTSYAPDARAWRYRVGLEGDLLGGDGLHLSGRLGAGATTLRTNRFFRQNDATQEHRISDTRFTGTGGLRLGVETGSSLVWWLGGDVNWSPFADESAELLQQATLKDLEPIDSETTVAVTLGFSIRR